MEKYETLLLPSEYTHLAPDGSEIRELLTLPGGGLAHCMLPAGKVAVAVKHRSVSEIWYFINGHGQVWRKQPELEEIVDVGPGVCITIPLGTRFQFRNTGLAPLEFLIATMPPWPGSEEADLVDGIW